MSRLFIYTKDVQCLTGKGQRTCANLLRTIRKKYNKAQYDLVTVFEFCEHMKLEPDMVIKHLK